MGEVSPMGGFFAQALDGLCAYVKSACAHDTSCLPFLSSAFTQNRRKDLHHSDSDFYLDVIKMCVCVCVCMCVCERQRQVAVMTVCAVTAVLGDSQKESL